mmetsp:Transcript_23929/g.55077  ORF Transcript_23929/g.55077 Transcript_23929/m.55077 type:complete len:88 (+) Transcript_23929:636-899(+)
MHDGDLVTMTMTMMMMMMMMIMLYFDDDAIGSDGGVMAMAAVRADVLLLKLLAPLLLVAVVVVDSATHIPVSNATRRGLGRCCGGPW